jgi:hypothetical protein
VTQFKCDRCGKVDELDKALVYITDEGKQTYICEECDKASRTTMSFVECAWCGEYVDESELEEVYDGDEGREVMICKKCFRDLIVPSGDTCVCCGEIIPEGEQVCLNCRKVTEGPTSVPELKVNWGARELKESGVGDALARGFTEGIENPCTDERLYVDDIDFSSINKLLSIHKIIDDAMEKRDRTVSIFISAENNAVSVNVYPVDHDKCQWIETKHGMICSNCGNCESTWDRPTYCSKCGELMHGVRKQDKS